MQNMLLLPSTAAAKDAVNKAVKNLLLALHTSNTPHDLQKTMMAEQLHFNQSLQAMLLLAFVYVPVELAFACQQPLTACSCCGSRNL